MHIRKTLLAMLAVAIAIAFSPLPELQAATLSPGSNPGVENSVVHVAKKKKAKKKMAKKKMAKKGKRAKSKGPGRCGVNMYYSKKGKKCMDARSKK